MTPIKILLAGAFLALPVHAQVQNSPLSGVQKNYYPNGQLAFVQNMSEGKINGEVKDYYPSGRVKGQVTYVNNLEQGLLKEYYENGQIKEEVSYIDGQIMNLKKYNEKGKLVLNQTGKFDEGCAIVK